MLEWLQTPMDTSRVHDVGFYLSWHARIMVLAWGILIPLGILIARYCKIMPKQKWPEQLDNRFWWNTHQACQYSALILMVLGLWFIFNVDQSKVHSGVHQYFGWTTLALAVFQTTSGLLRGSKGGPDDLAHGGSLRGDHFDMTKRRVAFEYAHKTAGYAVLALSVLTITTGLWQANAPNWMPVILASWWIVLFALAVVLQQRGLAFDTYQAIWGPDPNLPGNKRKPIGLGITRKD